MKFLFYLFSIFPILLFSQSREIDSLKHVIASKVQDTIKLQALSDLNWAMLQEDLDKAKEYAHQEFTLASKIKSKKWIAQGYNDLGLSFYKLGMLDSALFCYNLSLDIREKLKDKSLIASSRSKIGLIYHEMGEYNNALDNQLKALKIFEELKDSNKEAMTLNNISQIYYKLKNPQKEIEYGEKALAIHKKNENDYQCASVYGNLGNTYKQIGNSKKSMEYFNLALPIFIKYGDRLNEANVYSGLAMNLRLDFKDLEALEYYKKAYNISVEEKDKLGIEIYGHNISCVLTDLGKYQEALKYSLASLNSTEKNNKSQLLLSYRQLATIYAYINNGIESRFYLDKYADLKDSVFSKNSAAQIAEMETKYNVEKKDLEIAKHKAELEAQEKQNFIKNIIIVSIIALLLLLTIITILYVRKKKVEQQAKLDSEIAHQKEIRTKSILEAEEKERRRIAQDLHDGVGQLLSAAKLNLSNLESKIIVQNDEQKIAMQNALSLVDDSVKEVRAVSHNMMPNTLIKLGLGSAVREFITKLGNAPTLKVDLEIVGLDTRLDNQIETVLYRVIQEIVNNIIKHAKASHISMQLIRHESELNIMIEDNGIGFDTNKLDTFDGIGLKGIQTRIEFLNGNVHFDSFIGRGTTVIIDLPLS